MSDRAVTEIQQRIIRGEWASETSLSEGDIATELQMSKTPVRHALALLRREAWVEVLPRSGYRVVPITLQGARNLSAVRIALEGEAAAAAALRIGRNQQAIAALTEYVESEASDGEFDLRAHHRFHEIIAVCSGNEELRRLLSQVLLKLQRYWNLDWVRPHVGTWDLPHGPLLEAVIAGGPVAARERALEHATAGRDHLMEILLASDALLNADLTRRPARRHRPDGSR